MCRICFRAEPRQACPDVHPAHTYFLRIDRWIPYCARVDTGLVVTGWSFVAVATGLFVTVALSVHVLFDLAERRRHRP